MSKRKREAPGVTFYFDMIEAFDLMTDEECGQIFRAAMRLGRDHVDTDFESDRTKLIWSLIKPKIELSKKQYEMRCIQSEHAAYVRLEKKKGTPEDAIKSFEDWYDLNYCS